MRNRRRDAFTLIELLVVVAIIAVLAGLLLPTIYSVNRRARTMECLNNMKGIGVAMNAWALNKSYRPVRPTEPPEAVAYFDQMGWTTTVHNSLYCWQTDGSDGPNEARTIVNMLYPSLVKSGKVFYCNAFNRKLQEDFDSTAPRVGVNYKACWKTTTTDWWTYEWVNPRFPVPAAWAQTRYGIDDPGPLTPDAVMFCHYSDEHACVLHADGSAQTGRLWLEDGRPFGW